ncbi:DUF7344 domain-containing protein [Halobaculum lipolyticum]|uniref:DUF7344 domain-containing protein n=1 Tax=Halobaculum lipolyticum TaxID=3032001 RepID=A0ABD5WBA7_9EURY|nr:hypothetical protein [Halobaculum sp. DT31]
MDGLDLTVDELYEVLSDGTRRRLLWTMLDRGHPGGVDVPEELPGADGSRRRTRIRFQHVHLPKLVRTGLVRWDDDRGELRMGPAFDRAEPLLSAARDRERTVQLPGAV